MFNLPFKQNLRGRKIKMKPRQEIEFQEVLVDALSQKRDTLLEKKFEIPLNSRVLASFLALFLFLFVFLGFKAGQLQLLRGGELRALGAKNFERFYFER